MRIEAYTAERRSDILDLSIRAWRPVFDLYRPAVPAFVYDSFYPNDWESRQIEDLGRVLDDEPESVHLAVDGDELLGWVSVRVHPEDSMGEIHVLAVDPRHQRKGVASALMNHADDLVRAAGMTMMMVETGGDPGHAGARAVYEGAGYERWPVARYFKNLVPRRGGGQS